jgi:hypothetical protein
LTPRTTIEPVVTPRGNVQFAQPADQPGAPQTLTASPPPQVRGEAQLPQSRVPPHPSEIDPQLLPWAAQVAGVQVWPLIVVASSGGRAASPYVAGWTA